MEAAGDAQIALGRRLLLGRAVHSIREVDFDGLAERVEDDIILLVDIRDGLLQVVVVGAIRRKVDDTGQQPAPQPELVRALR